jgi:hypothetical protein
MKKFNAILGSTLLLATASSWLASSAALADNTSVSTAINSQHSITDHLVLSYFGQYAGPSLGKPSEYTNDINGNFGQVDGKVAQFIDSTFTGGFKATDTFNITFNYRFVFRPVFLMDYEAAPGISGGGRFAYRNKDPWVSIIAPKLYHANGVNVWGDIRLYVPVMSSDDRLSAVRATQITTYDVPKTRLTLGLFTFEMANMLRDVGAAGDFENFDLDLSPFASYQLTPTLALTYWTDLAQLTYATVGSANLPQGWANAAIDMQLGLGWDITSKVNLNPVVTVYPGAMSLENTTSART